MLSISSSSWWKTHSAFGVFHPLENVMKRWHEELTITLRNWRNHRRIHVEMNLAGTQVGEDPFQVDCTCDDQPGRFRKTDGYDCGHSQCYVCNHGKFPKRIPTAQEVLSALSLKEQLRELHERERPQSTNPPLSPESSVG